MGMGCPECGRTPIVFVLELKKWFCRYCRNEWVEPDQLSVAVDSHNKAGGKKRAVLRAPSRNASATRKKANPRVRVRAPKAAPEARKGKSSKSVSKRR